MARVGSTNHNLGMWLDGENPGAGAQDADSLGLNGNVFKIDRITSKLAADGSLAAAAVLPANLDATVVDGVTLEQDGTTKKLQVKGLGIAAAQIAADAVTTVKILDGNVTEAKIGALAVTNAKLAVDSVSSPKILNEAVVTAKIADDNVTPIKIAHNTTARKHWIHVGFTAAETQGTVGGVVMTDLLGLRLNHAFRVTGIFVYDNLGNHGEYTEVYAAGAAFLSTDRLTIREHSGVFTVRKGGVDTAAALAFAMGTTAMATIEIEWEDA